MSFAIYAPENKEHKPNDQLSTIQNRIQQLSELLDEDYDAKNRNEHIRGCRELADLIKADLQKQIKNGDNQGLKLMKFHNQQLKRLQNQENVQIADENTSLLQEQEHDVDIQIFEENVQQRKQRLQNVHRNLSSVKSIFEKISEVAEKQVEQMFSVEENWEGGARVTEGIISIENKNRFEDYCHNCTYFNYLCYRIINLNMNEDRQLLLEWKNEKAVLMQKLQIQEMYISEAKEREENLRKMNEAFMNTIQMPNNENVVQKMQKTVEQNQIQNLQETIDNLQIELHLLQDKLIEKDQQYKNAQKNSEKELVKLQNKIVNLETEKSSQENKENQSNFENQIKDIQNQLNQQKNKYIQELEKQKINYEAQLRKARINTYHSQQKNTNDEMNKLNAEIKKLKTQLKNQEQKAKQRQDELEQNICDIQNRNQTIQDNLKNQIVKLNAQLEEEKVNQNRQRNQSPSHPTTRIRTTQHLQQSTQDVCEVSSFLSRLPMKDIQQKLYLLEYKQQQIYSEKENNNKYRIRKFIYQIINLENKIKIQKSFNQCQ